MRRRSFISTMAGCTAGVLLNRSLWSLAADSKLTDDEFLDDLSRRSFLYFWEQSDAQTGITRDRARTDGSTRPGDRHKLGSTGATGFGLTAMCIGAERQWVTRAQARERVRTTLKTFANGPVVNEHGWFYHFLDVQTGERNPQSEMSTSDATWLSAGALTVRQYFQEDEEIRRLATLIYERMDYAWMCNGGMTLSHGWTPEGGFIKYYYNRYCQLACMVLLGIGSPTHAMKPETWYAWDRVPNEYDGYKYIGRSVLWTYQWPFAWFDLRNRREGHGSRINYWENSTIATRAHKAFCLDLAKKFPGYSENIWGITSSESAHGYKAWGGPPARRNIDGTVVPCAAAGSMMFTPDICLPALRAMKDKFGDKIYGRYGFADAFHPTNGWVCTVALGIDVGITLLSCENARSGNVWKWFMANPEPQRALVLADIQLIISDNAQKSESEIPAFPH
ncbi:MAG: glucoamylase family protein [Verrucomicrobiota bacterium]|jgi:hypothetical protein